MISDAGTPGISDPGERLVKECVAQNIPITAIPGPCAAVQALSCSGLSTDRFQFYGFLPKKEGELNKAIVDLLNYSGTTICYESPHRLEAALKQLCDLAPKRPVVVARELTKKFEEIVRGTAEELYQSFKDKTIKGEIVLLIGGKPENEEQDEWLQLSVQEHVHHLQETYSLTLSDAIKLAAKLRNASRRDIYQEIHSQGNQEE